MSTKRKLTIGGAAIALIVATIALAAEGDRFIRNPNQDKDLIFQVNRGGTDVNSIEIDGPTGVVSFPQGASGVGGGSGGVNLLTNSDAETGIGNVTASGGTFIQETAAPLFGNGSFSWDSNALSQTLTWDAEVVPNGLENRTCLATGQYSYTGTSGDYAVRVELDDGTAITEDLDLNNTDGVTTSFNLAFVCPENDSIQLEFVSGVADPGVIVLDNLHKGSDIRGVEISQASVAFHGYYPTQAGCSWQTASSSFAAFNPVGSCLSIVKEEGFAEIDATDNDLPDLVFPYLPPGTYVVTVSGSNTVIAGGAGRTAGLAINDGTNTRGHSISSDTSSTLGEMTTVASFSYATGGARTFSMHGFISGNILSLDLSSLNRRLTWTVVRYPTDSESAIQKPETQGARAHYYHSATDCVWPNTTSTTYVQPTGDATCTLETEFERGYSAVSQADGTGNNSGIVLTPPYTGEHEVCATVGLLGGSSGEYCAAQLYDGTNSLIEASVRNPAGAPADSLTLCGVVDYESVAAKTISVRGKCTAGLFNYSRLASRGVIEWQVRPYTQNFPQAVTLPEHPYQIRFLNSDATAVTDISDLQFSNLEIGKTYRVNLHAAMTLDTSTNTLAVVMNDAAGGLGNRLLTLSYQENGSQGVNVNIHGSTIFVAQTSLVVTRLSSVTGIDALRGDGTRVETFIELEELPYHEATTQWTP